MKYRTFYKKETKAEKLPKDHPEYVVPLYKRQKEKYTIVTVSMDKLFGRTQDDMLREYFDLYEHRENQTTLFIFEGNRSSVEVDFKNKG